MTNSGKSSHIGSILSITDILALLCGSVLKGDSKNSKWDQRDPFILSKGYAGAVVYSVLAESGFFHVPKLETHYQDGSYLSGHGSHRNVPGVELSKGSLGHGLSVNVGTARLK